MPPLPHLQQEEPGARTWAWLSEHPARFLGVSVAVTAALYLVPHGRLVIYPLMLLSTLAHEMGHGVAGLLVGGHFDSFVMNWDGSGVAHVAGYSGRVARAIVSAGGLVGPAFVAAGAFIAARKPSTARASLFGLGVLLALAELLVVRSLCGLLFVPLLAALCVFVARKTPPLGAQLFLSFLAVQLSLSVFSRGDYLFTRTAFDGLPSDVAAMSDALLLPYWFWGLLCGGVSVLALVVGLWVFLGGSLASLRRQPDRR